MALIKLSKLYEGHRLNIHHSRDDHYGCCFSSNTADVRTSGAQNLFMVPSDSEEILPGSFSTRSSVSKKSMQFMISSISLQSWRFVPSCRPIGVVSFRYSDGFNPSYKSSFTVFIEFSESLMNSTYIRRPRRFPGRERNEEQLVALLLYKSVLSMVRLRRPGTKVWIFLISRMCPTASFMRCYLYFYFFSRNLLSINLLLFNDAPLGRATLPPMTSFLMFRS